MKIVDKKNLKIIILKKLFKINKNYLKNFKIIFETINNFKKKKLLIINPLSGSHHVLGLYKNNIKNIGWWQNIIKIFKNFNIISLCGLNSHYGSSRSILNYNLNKRILNYKTKYDNLIKLKKNLLKKINISKIYVIIGSSLGGLKNFVLNKIYFKNIKYFLNIATSLKISVKNQIKNKINYLDLLKISLKKFFFKNYIFLKNIKLVRFLNNLNYLSKIDIKFKKKKIINFSYKIKNYKKNIFNYLIYKSNNFIKYFDIKSYLKILNNINLKSKKKYEIKMCRNKNIIIFFSNDIKFNLNSLFKTIYFFLKKKKNIILKILNLNSGHDSFLINNKIYKNIISKISNISER